MMNYQALPRIARLFFAKKHRWQTLRVLKADYVMPPRPDAPVIEVRWSLSYD